jgi:hypothetical protein
VFDYTVTVVNVPPNEVLYVNVWFDWNRDGDWDDTPHCDDKVPAPEWSVQNHQLAVAGAGTNTYTTPPFLPWHPPDDMRPIWMRITLSEQAWDPIAGIAGMGGAGPEDGYEYGETEDYYFIPELPEPLHDLGDAPDSSNSFSNQMTAYPGVLGKYPTVYKLGSPPHGPLHIDPRKVAYLGELVTLESEADMGPDEDPVNNLDPPNDVSDKDVADDGVQVPLTLPHCARTVFDYTVTVVNPPPGPLYVNVWFDWNRDGDWDDTPYCDDKVPAPEWSV